MPRRADQARDVTVERFNLDDVGAVIAEHLGGIGPHQHRRHVDDPDALQRSHGDARSRSVSWSTNGSTSARSRAVDVWGHAWGRTTTGIFRTDKRATTWRNLLEGPHDF